ncbi:MAG TPA: hypothetical protein VMV88_04080 [Gallionella sp.]|nr:hypothetical protein [Gallionella sp.]
MGRDLVSVTKFRQHGLTKFLSELLHIHTHMNFNRKPSQAEEAALVAGSGWIEFGFQQAQASRTGVNRHAVYGLAGSRSGNTDRDISKIASFKFFLSLAPLSCRR